MFCVGLITNSDFFSRHVCMVSTELQNTVNHELLMMERNGRSKHVELYKDCRINTYRKCILLVCLYKREEVYGSKKKKSKEKK